jgi:hypothetical protein
MISIFCNCVISHNEGGLGISKLVLSLKLAGAAWCMPEQKAEEIARARRQRVNCANSGLNLCEMVFACSLSLSGRITQAVGSRKQFALGLSVHPSSWINYRVSCIFIFARLGLFQ